MAPIPVINTSQIEAHDLIELHAEGLERRVVCKALRNTFHARVRDVVHVQHEIDQICIVPAAPGSKLVTLQKSYKGPVGGEDRIHPENYRKSG